MAEQGEEVDVVERRADKGCLKCRAVSEEERMHGEEAVVIPVDAVNVVRTR